MAAVTLSRDHFDRFVRLVQAAELKLAQIQIVQFRLQQELVGIVAKRDAYYVELKSAYDLPETYSSVRWDEESLAVDLS